MFPFTPGSDLAGEVVALGEGATRFRVGERVISTFTPGWIDGKRRGDARTPSYRTLGGYHPGVLADYVAFPEDWFVRAPASLSDTQASTLPCAGLTAWFALVERGRLRAGDIVLVEGTGGVALFGLQIAKAHGAEVIVSGSADKLARVAALGADHILEIVGGAHLGKAVHAAAVGGRIYQIGALEGFEASTSVMPLMLKDVSIQGIGTGHRRALEDLVLAVDRVGLKPVIDTRYALSDLHAALDHLDRGAFGKLVIDLQ